MSKQYLKKPKVLMVGPGRKVKGGITTVVDNYYSLGLENKVDLKYISTACDGNKLGKILIFLCGLIKFIFYCSKYDIVHIHAAANTSFRRKSIFVRIAHRKHKKIILHEHGGNFEDFYFKLSSEKQQENIRYIFSLVNCVIALSDEWAYFFSKYVCNKDKIKIIYNGVIIPDYEKQKYEDHNVLFLGRLGEHKGIYDLLEAIPSVIKCIPDAEFFVGGDGEIEKCKKIVNDKNISQHVHFLGWVKDDSKEKYFAKCSVFVLPSYYEGMPMSVLEAMAHGLATISTNVGGIPHIIKNGVDGVRIEAGEVPKLIESICKLLKNVKQKEQIGLSGRIRIKETFNINDNFNTLLIIYDSILNNS